MTFRNFSKTPQRVIPIGLAIIALLLPAAAAPPPSATDTVTLQREGSVGRITLRGTVRDFTGRSLEFLPGAGGGMQSFPAAEVVEVDTPRIDSHRRGIQALSAGQMDEATTAFDQALKEEQRQWVRRDILALSVRCALARGDSASAGTRFLALLQSDPETRQFELIPLTWTAAPAEGELVTQGRVWLSHSLEAARLLGASALLGNPQHGAEAEKELNQLATSADVRIKYLARAQQWRRSLRVPNLPGEEIERWQARIDEMPERLRGGPIFLVGHAFLARGEKHRAAAAFLWLPMVYDLDASLAAEACIEAAGALSDIGQKNEAAMLYREAADRFPGTKAAEQAAERFQQMRQSKQNPQEAPLNDASSPR
ncbi:MAG: tol-pal system YbgF family protein [Planctomycetaceae bacterium]